jgi:aspartate oxidase
VGVKGEYAKQGVVDASRKASNSNVPAHVFAMEIVQTI